MLLSRNRDQTYMENFFAIFSQEFWDEMTIIVNRNLVLNNSPSKTNPLKATTSDELVQFYGKKL
jgi:hypothetical protein